MMTSTPAISLRGAFGPHVAEGTLLFRQTTTRGHVATSLQVVINELTGCDRGRLDMAIGMKVGLLDELTSLEM